MVIASICFSVLILKGAVAATLREEPVVTFPAAPPEHAFELGQRSLSTKSDHRYLAKKLKDPHLLPIYPGYGSHFTYLYVGNPPQRQAVILDTASAWTAFPCTKCKDCGEHLDEYFDPSKSNSFTENVCNSTRCIVKNTYSTAQWSGYKGTDSAFIAGNDIDDVTDAKDYALKLKFGCITSANKAMQDQAADGVMGLNRVVDAFPFQYANSVGVGKVFSLCLRQGGGIFTIGGVDNSVGSPGHSLSYVAVSNASNDGFWRVEIEKLRFETRGTNKKFIDIGSPEDLTDFNSGKGTIIDSGSSQTYFPRKMGPIISKAFLDATGLKLTVGKSIKISAEDVKKLPTLLITLKPSVNGKSYTIKMPYTDYLETDGEDKYNIMLAATEYKGAVLGANFLEGYNVVFDLDKKRIGFIESTCKYEDFHKSPEIVLPDKNTGSCGVMKPISECTAQCSSNTVPKGNYIATGSQSWSNQCNPEKQESRACHMSCSPKNVEITTLENINCELPPWSECTNTCEQTRINQNWKDGKCLKGAKITRKCYASQCPTAAHDYLIFIDLKLFFNALWSSAVSEDLFEAVASLFKISPGNVEALVDSGAYVGYKKVQIQIRLRAKDYSKNAIALERGEAIIDQVNDIFFPADFLKALNSTSHAQDHIDFSRFGWMMPGYDIVLSSVTGFPISASDKNPDYLEDQVLIPSGDASSAREEQLKLILFGVLLAAAMLISLVVCLYFRLRRQYWDLEKDKGLPGNLRAMWESYKMKQKLKNSDYKKVRTMEMTQQAGSPFEDDEFDAALDCADDVNG